MTACSRPAHRPVVLCLLIAVLAGCGQRDVTAQLRRKSRSVPEAGMTPEKAQNAGPSEAEEDVQPENEPSTMPTRLAELQKKLKTPHVEVAARMEGLGLWFKPETRDADVRQAVELIAADPRLRTLECRVDLGSSQLTAAGVSELKRLGPVTVLATDQMELTEPVAKALAELQALRILSLWGGRWSGPAARPFRDHPALKELLLYEVEGSPEVLEALAGGNIENLTLNGIPLTERILETLGRFDRLRSLSLRRSPTLSNDGLRHLGRIAPLRSVELVGLPLEDDGLQFVRTLPHLERIHLYGMTRRISDAGLAHLGACPSLRDVTLFRTRITSQGLLALQPLQRLEHLRVDSLLIDPEIVATLRRKFPGMQINRPMQADVRIWERSTGTLRWLAIDGNPAYLTEERIGLLTSTELNQFDLQTGGWQASVPVPQEEELQAFSADSSTLVFWHRSKNTLRVVRASDGEQLLVVPGRNGLVGSAVLSHDGLRLAVSIPGKIEGSEIEIWNVATRTRTARLNQPGFYSLQPLQFSADGRHLAVAGLTLPLSENAVRVWPVPTQPTGDALTHPEPIANLTGFGFPRQATFSSDGRRLAIGSSDGIRVFDLATGEIQTLIGEPAAKDDESNAKQQAAMPALEETQREWQFLRFDPAGRRAVLGRSRSGERVEISLVDLRTGKEIRRLSGPKNEDLSSNYQFEAVRFSPTGRLLAVSFFWQPQVTCGTQPGPQGAPE